MNRRLSPAGRITLIVLFFAWGVTGVMVRMTVPHFKESFDLGFRDALLVQSAFFFTYLVFARASGAITARIGLRSAASLGLLLMAIGSAGLASATLLESFVALLPSVFVIASGITFLQVSANPLAAVEGTLRSASGNLTFAQGFNSLGTVAAPLIAGAAFLGADENPLVPVRWVFVAIAACLLVLSFSAKHMLNESPSRADEPDEGGLPLGPRERTRLIAGVAAIFLYVGAEVSVSTTLVNLLESEGISAAGRTQSALLTSIFWQKRNAEPDARTTAPMPRTASW